MFPRKSQNAMEKEPPTRKNRTMGEPRTTNRLFTTKYLTKLIRPIS